MSSAAQTAANFANAQHSTGPRTEAGKAASSTNALKHGLTAKTVLLPGEDEHAYRETLAEMLRIFEPMHVMQRDLVQELCDTQWRLHRCARLEADALSGVHNNGVPDYKALDVISKHEQRLKKLYTATLAQIHAFVQYYLANQKNLLDQAITVRRADVLQRRNTDFQAIGFDFSIAEVDQAIRREDTLRRAKITVTQQFAGL